MSSPSVVLYFVIHPHVHAWCLQRPEESVDPLELNLQTLMSRRMGSGNETRVLWESHQYLTAEPSLRPLHLIFQAGFFAKPGTHCLAQTAWPVSRTFCLPLPSVLGLQAHVSHPAFYSDIGGLNQDPSLLQPLLPDLHRTGSLFPWVLLRCLCIAHGGSGTLLVSTQACLNFSSYFA